MAYKLDPMLPGGINDSNSYFTEGEETSDDGVRSFTEPVEKPKPDVEALLAEIESRMPDDVLELFGSVKKEAV